MDVAKLLCAKFLRKERFKAPEGCGVLSCVDKAFFPCFQIWYYSIHLQNDIPISVFDMGMTNEQLAWAQEQEMNIIPISELGSLIFARKRDHWVNWNKPLYLLKSPFSKTLWLDADIVTCQPLEKLFEMMEKQPVVFECQNGWGGINNLHERLHTNYAPHQSGPPYMNNGVLGLCLERDKDMLEKWEYGVTRCSEDIESERHCGCWDQGALQWAVECLGILEIVKRDFDWNWCRDINPSYRENAADFIQSIDMGKANILHYAGNTKWVEHGKPFWTDWEEIPIPVSSATMKKYREKWLEWLDF